MKARKLIWLTSLVIMALVFAACDAGGGNGDDGANASSAVELTESQSVESEEFGGTLSVSYPENWFVTAESSGFLMSNNEEAMASSGPDDFEEIPEGVVVVNATVIPADMASVMGLEGELTPAVVLETFSALLGGDGMPEFGDIEELTIDGKAAARVSGSDDKFNATMYTIESDGNFIFGFGATRPDEADANAELIQAIIASTSFTPSE